jgi:hypothetical protein
MMIKDIIQIKKQYDALASYYELLNISNNSIKYGIEFEDKTIIPKQDFIVEKNGYKNLNFAVQDFENIFAEIRYKSNLGFIPKNSKFHISNLKVYKSYIDPKKEYSNYLFAILNEFSKTYNNIINFQKFFELFSKFIENNVDLFSFSKFIYSNNISIFSSGLAFSLSNDSTNNFQSKLLYLQDSYFSEFENICLRNNCIIDLDIPWLIIRRVDNAYIEHNIDKYENIFEIEISLIYDNLKSLYIIYINNFLLTKYKNKVDIDNFVIDKNQFIDFIFKVKLKEKNISYDENSLFKIKNFIILNSTKNSIKDSVQKLNNIGTISDTIYKDFRSLYL